jgi:hypothetical protein
MINNEITTRLPCRGCLPSCKIINSCGNKPWRLIDVDVPMISATEESKNQPRNNK